METIATEWYHVKFFDMEEDFNFSEMNLVRRSLDISYSKIPDKMPILVAQPLVPGLWYIQDPENKIIGHVKHMKLGRTILTEPTHF